MNQLVKVHGLRELAVRLRALPQEVRKAPLKKALREIARPVQAEAKRIVRKKTHALAENIIITRDRRPQESGATEAVKVTVRAKAKAYKDSKSNRRKQLVGQGYEDYGPLFYARFLEVGTSHQPAYPFLVAAFDAMKAQMPEAFKSSIAPAIHETVRKLRR